MRKALYVITAGIFILTALSGCSLTQKLGFGNKDMKAASSTALSQEESSKLESKMPVNLYFGSGDNTKLMLEVRYIDKNAGTKGTASLATAIVNELISGPTEKDLKATIPEGTKLAGPISISSGTATVNLTKEFVDKHPGGAAASKMTIYSIVNSLTELSDIQRVKFLVNGKTVTDFKGAYQFDAPFPRTASLISKTPVNTASNNAKSSTTASKETADKGKAAATPTPAPKASATPSVKPAATPAASAAVTPAATSAATPKPTATPKKSSTVLPQSSNINTYTSKVAVLENID